MALATLAAGDVRDVIACFGGLLEDYREVVNRLNVYPVPDGDTGTNMSLTVASVVRELEAAPEGAMADVCRAVAHGSLMGARGNSGVILSQLLRGMAEALRNLEQCDSSTLRAALHRADAMARQAVVRPVEGTILTVSRAAATGSDGNGDLAATVRGARSAARAALERTPELLPVLQQAGVVDAGGAGLCLLYDALCHVVAGDPLPTAPAADRIHVHAPEPLTAHGGDGDVASLRYEVMYFLEARDDAIGAFRDVWAGIGDSIVVVGGDGLFNCHIHTDDVGAAIEAALDVGRTRGIRVTDLAEQVIEERWVREGEFEGAGDRPESPAPHTGVVAVVQGDGIGRIFRSLGVRVLVAGGQSMNPSTEELLAAVRATGSAEVVLLPNNKNIVPVANQAASLADVPVSVVPTRSIVEGFAALLAYDPDATAEVNGPAMTESCAHVLAAEVTRAVRDSATAAGEVREGDWIGLTDDGIVSVAESIAVAACAMLEQVVTERHELVTVIEGEGATPANTRRITQWLAESRPSVSVEVHHGGQPLYPYLFGIE